MKPFRACLWRNEFIVWCSSQAKRHILVPCSAQTKDETGSCSEVDQSSGCRSSYCSSTDNSCCPRCPFGFCLASMRDAARYWVDQNMPGFNKSQPPLPPHSPPRKCTARIPSGNGCRAYLHACEPRRRRSCVCLPDSYRPRGVTPPASTHSGPAIPNR